MLTSNLGRTNSHTSKYCTPLSCDSLSTWIFHTPCVEKKHSTCYIISSFIEARHSNHCQSMYLGDQYLVKFTFLFLRTSVHLPTSNLPYLKFTSSNGTVEYPRSSSPKTINLIQHKSVLLIFTNRRTGFQNNTRSRAARSLNF